jgi:hypothetical protein
MVPQDIQAAVDHERQLRRQINAALWQAVAAMERWSSAAVRYMSTITTDTNNWLEQNAQLIAHLAGPGAPGTQFKPVPAPCQVNSKGPLRRLPPVAQDVQQQDEAAVDVTAQVRLKKTAVLRSESASSTPDRSSTSIRHVAVGLAEENNENRTDRWATASLALNKVSFKVHSSDPSRSFTTASSITLHSRAQFSPGSVQVGDSMPASRRTSWSSIAADETRAAAAQGRWAASIMTLNSQDSFGPLSSRHDNNSPGSTTSGRTTGCPSPIPLPQPVGQAASRSRRSSRSVTPELPSAAAPAAGAAQATASGATGLCTRSNSMLLEEADADSPLSWASSRPTPLWSRRRTTTSSVFPIDVIDGDPAAASAVNDSRSYRVTGSDVQISLSVKRKEQH